MAQEFQRKVKVFFDEANTGEGITPGSLCRVIRKACPNFRGSDQEIAQMFLEIDADDDRLISWEEFSDALFKRNPKEVTRAELEAKFKEMDADGSGKLDRSELKRITQDLGIQCTEEELDASMAAADPDGNGVDMQEFLKAWEG